jgi:hypothetical protein
MLFKHITAILFFLMGNLALAKRYNLGACGAPFCGKRAVTVFEATATATTPDIVTVTSPALGV